jgi:nucleotide-binding universal stress UspA family protein
MPGTTDPRPVVVAVDPSSSARDAAAWAADIAADWAAPLHVVHVAPGDPRDLPVDRLPVWLVELVAMAERAGARPCTVEAQPGDVVDTIAARGVGARMVVLGSYGEGAFDGMLVGSAALGVVERVGCPLAVVRGSAPRIAPPRGGPVVVGVDASRAGEAAAVFGADVAASLGARLLVVRCRSDFSTTPYGEPRGSHRCPEALAAEASALERQLAPIAERHPALPIDREIVDVHPVVALTQFAAGARAVVVGARGCGGLAGMAIGSTSQAVLEFATCPVIVVRPQRSAVTMADTAKAR